MSDLRPEGCSWRWCQQQEAVLAKVLGLDEEVGFFSRVLGSHGSFRIGEEQGQS